MGELSQHATKTILLQLPIGDLGFELISNGLLQPAFNPTEPTLILHVSAKALSDLAGSSGGLREQAFKAVKITGDADLAQLIGRLAGQLRWEYEEDLAQLIGDAPAHLAVQQGRKFISASRAAAADLVGNVIEYVTEENQLILNQRDFMIRKNELNALRDSVDRLEKRIQLLQHKVK